MSAAKRGQWPSSLANANISPAIATAFTSTAPRIIWSIRLDSSVLSKTALPEKAGTIAGMADIADNFAKFLS
jgi:hypothetical protein